MSNVFVKFWMRYYFYNV